jgi:hypothetical protein
LNINYSDSGIQRFFHAALQNLEKQQAFFFLFFFFTKVFILFQRDAHSPPPFFFHHVRRVLFPVSNNEIPSVKLVIQCSLNGNVVEGILGTF